MASADATVTKSMEFIVCEEDGRFVVREDAMRMLEEVEGDMSVIALAGLQRTGKSFLMNLLSRERIEDGACGRLGWMIRLLRHAAKHRG